MNPRLALLQPYPFEKLRVLLKDAVPSPRHRHLRLSIGEPEHSPPGIVLEALSQALSSLSQYPTTQGNEKLRLAISQWIADRHNVPAPNPDTEILPVNGTREALFAIAQCVINPDAKNKVLSPNPFYQIYEGAALLAGGSVVYTSANAELQNLQDVALVYVCSPHNPTGQVMNLDHWKKLFELSDKYGFIIASDECYSDIYPLHGTPPLGGLSAARQLGRDYQRLVIFASLSKRSSLPGLRSGFVAGDAKLMKKFLLYRTYHGCAMSPAVQAASTVAWSDEVHVEENRRLYDEKFTQTLPLLQKVAKVSQPSGAFYYWLPTPNDDTAFARELLVNYNVAVLPGSFLGRMVGGVNPGAGFVRIAMTLPLADCLEAATRIRQYYQILTHAHRP